MSEDRIHNIYKRIQEEQLRKNQKFYSIPRPFKSARPPALFPRWNAPSLQSRSFNVGEGFVTAGIGDTVLVAQLTLPALHSGVLTGIVQIFPESDTQVSMINSITWALRVNGMPVHTLTDWVGEFSKPFAPMSVHIPLTGSDTLGSTYVTPGGDPTPQVPTVALYATNNFDSSAVLQGRLIGYTFPLSEMNDELGSY